MFAKIRPNRDLDRDLSAVSGFAGRDDMTRMDAAAEPSMEDILASIRRIIAEDPPGSRPGPLLQPKAAATVEPRLRSVPSSIAADMLPDPSRSASVESGKAAEAPGSSYAPISITPERSPRIDLIPAPEPEPVKARSVQDQLDDVLGERPVSAEVPAAPSSVVPALADAQSEAVALGQPAPAGAAFESRTVFTVTRDGFIPEATPAAKPDDPFEFDLGPSPFAAREDLKPREGRNDGDAVQRAIASVSMDTASLGSALVPAVSITMAEDAAEEVQAAATHMSAPETQLPESTAALAISPVSDAPAPVRSMEDTVADLLRPMLRTWLAENMPKIVETALRRELEDNTRPGYKAAAE